MHGLGFMVLAVAIPLVVCYDEKYDKIDLDKILGDDKLFDAYIDCLLDKGPCTVEHSADFKKLLPEVIAEACAKCTAIQKQGVRKTVQELQKNKPEAFKEFKAKYDPDGQHEKAFTDFILKSD